MESTRLRILFVTDQLRFGGAERHLVALAGALAQRGHAVAVASLKEGGELAPALANTGIVSERCCQSRGGLDIAAIGRLARIVDEHDAQVMVATSQYSLMFGVLARMRAQRRCALAFICHSMGVVQRGGAARLRFLVYRQFYGRADTVIFVSALQRRYFAAMGIVPGRSEMVHNGIDLRRFAPTAVVQQAIALRQQCGFAPHELVIGLCAAFREEKRQVDMLEALARLRSQGVPARLLLAGDGPMRPQIEACRDRLGLAGAVVLADFQEDVRPAIAACDVVAGQHLGVIRADYNFYTYRSGEDRNDPGGDSAFPADICGRNDFLKKLIDLLRRRAESAGSLLHGAQGSRFAFQARISGRQAVANSKAHLY